MKNKKRNLIIFSTFIILVIGIYLIVPKTKEEESNKTKPNVNTNGFLTLMLEQDDGTYKKTTSNTWPGDGYAFNNELSGCERGGELVYDRETNIVKLISGGSDKCYVYFDKYNVVQISNITSTKTTNSVTLTVTIESGENPVDKYYFSSDGGKSYQESTSPNYTFSNLTPNTTYTFKVYAKDTQGYESNEESIQVTTDNYVNPIVNSVTVTGTTTSSISVSVSASGGTNSVATYYYSINNGAYTSSTSNTKTFTGLSSGTTYTIKVYVKDTNGVDSSVYTISAETENTVLLADYIKGLYTSQGTNGIYYHTSSLANSAADNSYRYAGASEEVNNYVCFGSTASTCPSDNLYRIIGVFGSEVKLIKSTNYGDYAWDSSGINTWSKSSVKTTLNTTFYNTISPTWQNKIATHTWKVGGVYSVTTDTAKQYYDLEVGSGSSSTTDSMKIGLMYTHDYGFAASNDNWTKGLWSYSTSGRNFNWLYIETEEWTITRYTANNSSASVVNGVSGLYGTVYVSNTFNIKSIRPCFYLTTSTTYVSGSGTSSDPIRIK